MQLELINKMEKICKDFKKEGYQPALKIKGDILIITIKVSGGDIQKIKSIMSYRAVKE